MRQFEIIEGTDFNYDTNETTQWNHIYIDGRRSKIGFEDIQDAEDWILKNATPEEIEAYENSFYTK